MKKPLAYGERIALNTSANQWFRDHRIRGFYALIDGLSLEEGTRALLQVCGIGKLKPNILLMGYKNEWWTCPEDDICQYFDVLQ